MMICIYHPILEKPRNWSLFSSAMCQAPFGNVLANWKIIIEIIGESSLSLIINKWTIAIHFP